MAQSTPEGPTMYGLNQIGYATMVSCVFFIALSFTAVGLRLWTRNIIRASIGVDDWLIISSVIVFLAFCGNVLVGVYTIGGGQVYSDPSEAALKGVQYLKSEYAIPPLNALNMTLIRLSITFFYRRLFDVAAYRKPINITIGANLVWFVAAIIGGLLYCIPIQKFWTPNGPGSCFDFAVYFLVMELLDLLLDVVVICLPIRVILSLQLTRRRKFGLLVIFALAAFVIFTDAIKIAYLYQPNNQLLALGQASLWSVINLGVGILCACLPTYRPLFSGISSSGSTYWNRYFSRGTDTDPSTGLPKTGAPKSDIFQSPGKRYAKVHDGHGDTINLTKVTTRRSNSDTALDLESDEIRIQREIEIEESERGRV